MYKIMRGINWCKENTQLFLRKNVIVNCKLHILFFEIIMCLLLLFLFLLLYFSLKCFIFEIFGRSGTFGTLCVRARARACACVCVCV